MWRAWAVGVGFIGLQFHRPDQVETGEGVGLEDRHRRKRGQVECVFERRLLFVKLDQIANRVVTGI